MRPATLLATLLVITACAAPPPEPPPGTARPSGAWFGQPEPGLAPAVFAPGVVSTGRFERDLAWTPDGRQAFWTVYAPAERHGMIVTSRQLDDGSWSAPEIPPMFVGHNSLEPFVTPDGAWLYFASTRPLPGESDPGDWNLWRAPRDGEAWGEPEPLPPPISGDGDEYYPSLTRDGRLVFTAEREGSLGGEDLWSSHETAGGWSEPENLGAAVNSAGPEFNSLIHPGGDWILFGSARAGDSGGGDLYVSFVTPDGWSPAQALAAPLNSAALDFCPALSPDGELLFFSSRRSLGDPAAATSYDELAALLDGPGNGQSDLFWVRAEVLEPYRP